MSAPDQPPLADLYGVLAALVHHVVAKDLFPETAVHALTPAQSDVVHARGGALVRIGAERLRELSAPPDPGATP
jgi:hypothetical protein